MKSPVDMSPGAIEQRLLAVSRLSNLSFHQEPRVDMSPAAIEARLCECAEMSAVCLQLGASGAMATATPKLAEVHDANGGALRPKSA
jgi:hypothetical protein